MRDIETWKDVEEYEGLYKVSNLGRIKHLEIKEEKGTGNYDRSEHMKSFSYNNKGYAVVTLYKNNNKNQQLVHRIVAAAFMPNPQKFNVVNHIDENSKNNMAENLEWCTQKYNMNHGTTPKRIGKANSKAVVQIDRNTHEKIKLYESAMEAQRRTGISNGCINDCLHGRRMTAGGYIWKTSEE